ncbi:L-asparaginase/GlutRNAGln amidotransferase subunit D [Burkholderia sp. Ch1-1]|uniref:L-asparaginase/GlutRNAGln amidotransferase subunit D n=1 Tax=Paraburkholderia dioscoreae TaxID=2604047 RepID=A0A5Q4Z792_9BURK|nr:MULTISPECIES: asparaginase [Paraburkholderia]EIF28846.1 L-asparaginase/GlutRNAGln amidotransferase subunit D [Burkholderia sp. Ch1-1]MDR8400701.1 asparaginase [Paraburkholderia sp. USG1]VVD26689.1 L-asparaginase/GlutRNAGln amidotransferase subunit D [Paraburkholderia dioscoreae]
MSGPADCARPKIAVIGTGGTFAMHARGPFDWIEYSESGIVLPVEDLLARMGDLAPHLACEAASFRRLGSTSIGPRDWVELARLIETTLAGDPQIRGVVVTHGTATLEETAWFLDLTLATDVPVVITGAQRPFNTTGSDAAANLRAALAVASSEGARGLGALVAMDGLVFAARDATKVASFELAAFEAPGFGPLARVEADASVSWRRKPVLRNGRLGRVLAYAEQHGWMLPRVDIAMSYAGADGAAIDAFVAAGARAIVSAGLPPGRPAEQEAHALQRAREAGVLIVQSTRALRGMVPEQAFLQRDGFLAGSDLTPLKLRILLMAALTQTADARELQSIVFAH